MKPRPPTFQQAMKMMRARDGMTQEEGFHRILSIAKDHVADLVKEFRGEKDPGLRAWLVELLGFARSPDALPLFVELLDSPDESLRAWARRGLERLDSKEARTILWKRALKPRR